MKHSWTSDMQKLFLRHPPPSKCFDMHLHTNIRPSQIKSRSLKHDLLMIKCKGCIIFPIKLNLNEMSVATATTLSSGRIFFFFWYLLFYGPYLL